MIPDPVLQYLRDLSLRALGFSSPNPPVACVITDTRDNILVGAHTQRTGGNHAEREAYSKFSNDRPHKLYVTLEPCNHFGRTPPCLDLILEKKPLEVIIGNPDPNPILKSRNTIEELEQQGIRASYSDEIRSISYPYLSGFLTRIQKNRPVFLMKAALSKDGYYCNTNKDKIALSNPHSNAISQFIRSKIDAIVVGPGTVFGDNPSLDFRSYLPIDSFEIDFGREFFFSSILTTLRNGIENDFPHKQPDRVFLISSSKFPDSTFFEKQRAIATQGNEKIIFLVLDRISEARESLLKLTTDFPLIFMKENIQNSLLEIASLRLWNFVLIEGGNSLYSSISSIFNQNDLLIQIHTQKELNDGIEMDLNQKYLREKEVSFFIDDDYWEVFRYSNKIIN